MLHLKIDISGSEWLDVIFKNRNKSYGAYQLRRLSTLHTTKALLLSSAVFVLLFLMPSIIRMIKGKPDNAEILKQVEVILQPPPPVNPEIPPPPPEIPPSPVRRPVAQAPRSRENLIKFPPPIVKADELVHDNPPELKDLKDASPGQATIQGDPSAEIVLTITAGKGNGNKEGEAAEDKKVYDFSSLETLPQFPGGIAKFYQYLQKTVKYPETAKQNNIQGKVFVSFVVEKNGILTDIKVEHKVGGGLDDEAIRVLKESPHWIPGIQNGKPVRVKYNIPISFSLSQ